MKLQKKIAVLGNDGVGKTSIVLRYTKGTFSNSYLVTLGVDFYEASFKRTTELGSHDLYCQIWDLASQKSFISMRAQYLSYTNIVVIVVDVERTSVEYIQPWIDDVHAHAGPTVPFVIALNKIDLTESAKIERIRTELEHSYGVKVYATSAKTGQNIEEMFDYVADYLIQSI